MKQHKLAIAITSALGLAVASGLAVGGIANTKHNLGSDSNLTVDPQNNRVSAGTDEICVFCHTPHGSDTGASVPLWNKKLGAGGAANFSTYADLGTSTLDGATMDVGSVSIACLSCHDGTQAMDNIINAPGSGGYDATGGGATGLAYTWAQGDNGTINVDSFGRLGKGTTNTVIALLGTDLKNDHPIGIQYAGGPKTTALDGDYGAATADFRDADFKTAARNDAENPPAASTFWWVNTTVTGATTSREKTDMILYTRNATGTARNGSFGETGYQPFVECASCHDPHTETTTFLRMPEGNSGSQICLACHSK